MKIWVATVKETKKVIGVFSELAYAKKHIREPENVDIACYTANVVKKKGD